MSWNHSLSRILASSAVAIAAVSSSAYAIPKGPCDTKPDVCCDEPKPGPFAFAFPMDVDLNCPKDFYVYASGLAFQAKQDGMAFAIRDGDGVNLPITGGTVLNFSTDSHDWDYNPGVRVGLGFYVHHDAWSLDFDWTWVNVTNYSSQKAQGSDILLPLWLSPAAPQANWRSVSANWKASYNTLDARLGKPYHVSRYLILNPHFGVRAGWIDQHYGIHYGGNFSGQTDALVHMSNDFWGVGARAGLVSQWVIGKGWNLFGNIAASMLFGKFQVDQSVAQGPSGSNIGYDMVEDFYQNVPNMEMQLGISWNKYFNKRKSRVCIAAAYEFHEWWDQFNARKFYGYVSSPSAYNMQSDTVSRGNLSMNGFSLTLRIDI